MNYLFVADRMLGRLAKMLRLLGYDTIYASDISPAQLKELARREDRVILTRGEVSRRFTGMENVFSLKSEKSAEQLREVLEKYRLDLQGGLWTRCTLCNATITRIEKAQVESLVKPKVFQLYAEFYRCSGCGQVYWQGSHVERILRNLAAILGKPAEEE
jgi:hypothetical protein